MLLSGNEEQIEDSATLMVEETPDDRNGGISQKIAPRGEKEKRHRKRKSEIWEWFNLVENSSAIKCIKCGWSIKYSGSTTACREHTKKCVGIRAAKLEKGYVDPEISVDHNNSWIYDAQGEVSHIYSISLTLYVMLYLLGNMKRQFLQNTGNKLSDFAIAMPTSETFEVRCDISAAKAKLFQAETTGSAELIRVYGDILTELLKKENDLRLTGNDNYIAIK